MSQIDTRIAIDGVERQSERSHGERSVAYLHTMHVIQVASYVYKRVGRQRTCTDIQVGRSKPEMDVVQFAIRHIERQPQRSRFRRVRFCGLVGFTQVNPDIRIIQPQPVQRILALRDIQLRTGCLQSA